jgi:FixJ family two-component response regulator
MERNTTVETRYGAAANRDRLIHIVDADPATCEALCVLFRLEGFQTGFSVDTASFYAELERRRPDVAIINVRIGADDGLAALRRIKAMRQGIAVFMIENDPKVDLAVMAMKAGATHVVTKPIDNEGLLRAVRDTLRQDVRVGPAEQGSRPVEIRGFAQLTDREREVLEFITNGHSNKEVSRNLGISPRTVEVHRSRASKKLGARNTADLIRIVLMG